MKSRRPRFRYSRDTRVYGHTTTAMHERSTPPPLSPPPISGVLNAIWRLKYDNRSGHPGQSSSLGLWHPKQWLLTTSRRDPWPLFRQQPAFSSKHQRRGRYRYRLEIASPDGRYYRRTCVQRYGVIIVLPCIVQDI